MQIRNLSASLDCGVFSNPMPGIAKDKSTKTRSEVGRNQMVLFLSNLEFTLFSL